jgi:hypothetical protein
MIRAQPKPLRGKRDKVLLLMGFAGAFRRSELAALDVADIHLDSRKMTVTLHRSKTDQEGAARRITLPCSGGERLVGYGADYQQPCVSTCEQVEPGALATAD